MCMEFIMFIKFEFVRWTFVIVKIGHTKLHYSMLDIYKNSSLRILLSLGEQVHNLFTKFIFQIFQYYNNLESQRHQVK